MMTQAADCLDNYVALSKKHCPTIFDEINMYHPKENVLLCQEIFEFRQQTKSFQKDKEYDFFSQEFIKQNLDEKWEVELYNLNCFLRLYDLLQIADKISSQAVMLKLNQFKQKILQNKNPYPALKINFSEFNLGDTYNESIDWEN